MKWLVRIGTWVKSHIVITIIAVVVTAGGITSVVILADKNKEEVLPKVENIQEKDVTMICSVEYDYGEKASLEATYDYSQKKLKRLFTKHTEFMEEEDELTCSEFNSLSGISCDFDKSNYPYTMTVEIITNELNSNEYKTIGKYDIKDYFSLSLSLSEMRKKLTETDDKMHCYIDGENNINEKKDDVLKTDGYYVATNDKKGFDYRYGSIKFYSGNKFDWVTCLGAVDYGTGAFYRGTYRIDGNKLILNVNKMLDMQGWVKYNETFNYTIIDENTIKLDNGYTYKWQSKPLENTSHPKSL